MDSLIFQHKLVRACVSNLEDIILFEKSVLNDISEFTSKNNLIKLLKSSNSCILLIKNANDNICAYGIATLRHYRNNPSGHIYKIAVDKDCRRIGLATNILKELEKYIVQHSIYKIYAEVRESNTASMNLFKKNGYKKLKTLFAYYTCLDESYELENGIKLYKIL